MEIKVDGHTRILGLMGDPVEHTMSPAIHNFIAGKMKDNIVYVPFHVTAFGLHDAVRGAYELGIAGMNVTVPHKQRIISELVSIDENAAKIGAVNTIVKRDGGYEGCNTDCTGFISELDAYGEEVKDRTVIMIGAGGAARAVAYALKIKGVSCIYMLNRSVAKAKETFDDMDFVNVLPLDGYAEIPDGRYLCVQCTSVGLAPHYDMAPIEDKAFYRLVSTGIDLIYNPAVTKFMKNVADNGGKAYNGLKMLIGQAVASYELFSNESIPADVTEALYEELDT